MANFFCADCNWQGNAGYCPTCGNATESLYVEDITGMPRNTLEMEFAAAIDDPPVEDIEDDL